MSKNIAPQLLHDFDGVKFNLAILISFLWLFVLSAVYVPWRGQWLAFLYAGVGPLIAAWGLYWVVSGFCSRRRY